MPTRIWIWAAIILVVLAAAFIALVVAVPDPVAPGTRDLGANLEGVAAEPAGLTPEETTALEADVAALATARQSELPPGDHVPVLGGPTTLTLVTAASTQITFAYEVEVDPGNYTLPADPTELFPGLNAETCRDRAGTCFVVNEQLAADTCADTELRALIDRGAVVRYLFRDLNRRPLADASVFATDCAAPAAPA